MKWKFYRWMGVAMLAWAGAVAGPWTMGATNWFAALPPGPYSSGDGSGTAGAPDQPVAGFVGPAGNGVSNRDASGDLVDNGQMVNPAFVGWATTVQDYSPANRDLIDSTWSDPTLALGPVTGDAFDVVSLGDLSRSDITAGVAPGSITLEFDSGISDGPGADFVVFENALELAGTTDVFAELAYVEVSSDGVNFARFPSAYNGTMPPAIEQSTYTEVHASGNITYTDWPYVYQDPTKIYNLAGKHLNGYGESWGTPFDLAQLANNPLVLSGQLDLNNVRYVRIVDIPGSGAFTDSAGHPIYDPWVTMGSPGFDLEAIGVLNNAPFVVNQETAQAPVITQQPSNETVGVGQAAVFTAGASGAPQPTYHWERLPAGTLTWAYLHEGGNYAGTTTARLTVTGTTTAMTGDQFCCVAINAQGSTPSNFVTLTVHILPPVVSGLTGNPTVVAGNAASFTVVSSGGTGFQWQSSANGLTWGNLTDGGGISGSLTPTLTVNNVTAAMAGVEYRCVVGNSAGPSTSPAATLAVVVPIVISVQPVSQVVKAGGAATLSVAASTIEGTLAYQWQLNGAAIAKATSASYTIAKAAAANAGNYSVVVSNGVDSPVTSSTATLALGVAPKITTSPVSQPVTVGSNSTAIFRVVANGVPAPTIQWQSAPAGNSSFSNVVNGGNFSGATSANLTVTTPDGTLNGTQFRAVVTNLIGNTTNSVTSKAATLTVDAPAKVTTLAMVYGNTTLSMTGNLTISANSSVTFTVGAAGNALKYQWLLNGVNIKGATKATYTIAKAAAFNDGTYSVIVSNPLNPTPSAAGHFVLTVQTKPAIITQPKAAKATAGGNVTVTFSVTASGNPIPGFAWLHGGSATLPENVTYSNTTNISSASSTLILTGVTAGDGGSYQANITNAEGSVKSSAVQLTIK
jgi:hypothetical protein